MWSRSHLNGLYAVFSSQLAPMPANQGKPSSLINLWLDPDVYAPGIVNHSMYE